MVSAQSPITVSATTDTQEVSAWLASLDQRFSAEESKMIQQAYALASQLYAEQVGLTGLPLIQHAVGTAAILMQMNMDAETIAAAILHAVPDYQNDSQEMLQSQFGNSIASLVEGIARMEKIQEFSEIGGMHDARQNNPNQAQQIESLRKMLLAMVQDIRVVLIKLAERTQTLRHLSKLAPALQQRIARET
ncbi:MAG: GTP pyrophosphokinase, partial [Methylophilales bacterium 16-45-7]